MMSLRIPAETQAIRCGDASCCFVFFFQVRDLACPSCAEVLTLSIIQLTIADVNTTRLYHFEENEKDNSPNTEHLGFDNSQMAAIPKMHLEFS